MLVKDGEDSCTDLVRDEEVLQRVKEERNIVKGRAIPLQAWTGPEGSRWLRLPDFKTVGT